MPGDHSTLAPSSAEIWMHCPGSVALCARLPRKKTTYNMAEGTVAHALCEEFTAGRLTTFTLQALNGAARRQEGFDIIITDEMISAVTEWADTVKADIEAAKAKPSGIVVLTEKKVTATSVDEALRGTADKIVFQKGDFLKVYDFKYGKGVAVGVVENPQMGIYGLGAMDTFAGSVFGDAELVIVQPRNGGVSRWRVPSGWFDGFRAKLKNAVLATRQSNAPCIPGAWCRWCAANEQAKCAAVRAEVQKQAGVCFDVVPSQGARMPAVEDMPVEKLVLALRYKPMVEGFFKAVKDNLQGRMEAGEKVPGIKFVNGRGTREWEDPSAVVAKYGPTLGEDALFEKKILSPAKLEKVIGKSKSVAAEMASLVVLKPGEVTIAFDEDPRAEVGGSAQEAFALPAPMPDEDKLMSELMGTVKEAAPKREPLWP